MNEDLKWLTFFIHCKKNCPRRVLEASKNYRYFIENGLQPVDNPKNADLIVIHSCGGFNLGEETSILTLKQVLNVKSKSSKVIMTGCLTKINKEALEPYADKALIASTNDLGVVLDEIIRARTPYNSVPESSLISDVNELYRGTLVKKIRTNLKAIHTIGFNIMLLKAFKRYLKRKLFHTTGNSYFHKKTFKIIISEGCTGNCTYCAIKFAMPAFHSVPEEQILENFRIGLKQNYKVVALSGADIGAYGVDSHSSLANLLEKIFAIEGDYKLIINDLNARWLINDYENMLSVLSKNAEKIFKILLPIQSGSDRILRLMKRHYTIDEVKKCILDIQKNIPNLNIETHILVGFPTETEEDFQMSLNLVRDIQFSKVEIYKYEDRPQTPASKMTEKVSDAVMNQRVKILTKATKMTARRN